MSDRLILHSINATLWLILGALAIIAGGREAGAAIVLCALLFKAVLYIVVAFNRGKVEKP